MQYELDEFDASKERVVRILLYAGLLSLQMSRDLLDLVTEQVNNEIVFPPERQVTTFRSHARSSSTNLASISTTRHRRCWSG